MTLAACHRGSENKDAVRQGIIDHLASVGMNMPGMTVEVTSVQFNGTHADAVVSITPKGGAANTAMTMPYKLEQKDGKWVVTGTTPHPGATAPAGDNPHGGGAMPPGGMSPGQANPHGSGMPSPSDLPPVKKE
jgi:hypothetical protein